MKRTSAVVASLKRDTAIRSKIRLNCKLLRPYQLLKAHLRDMPCLMLISSGTILRYTVLASSDQDPVELEFGAECINLVSYPKAPDLQNRNLNLIILLCTLSYLRGFYYVELDELYPYLVEALRLLPSYGPGPSQQARELEETISSLNKSNLSLSRNLLSLHAENIKLSTESELLKGGITAALAETKRRFGRELAEKIITVFKESGATINV